jgi:RIO-like serine/threonine protein kinase
MKLNSLVIYHVNKLSTLEFEDARDYLISVGFNQIGSGCESVVYSRKGFDYVIKLHYSPFTFSGMKRDIPSEKHFVPTVVFRRNDFNIVIQKKVEHTVCAKYEKFAKRYKEFVKRMEKTYQVSDIHDENVGVIKGRFWIFDWNTAD